jgi:hypothetical protein
MNIQRLILTIEVTETTTITVIPKGEASDEEQNFLAEVGGNVKDCTMRVRDADAALHAAIDPAIHKPLNQRE